MNDFGILILFLVITIVIFLICREIVCWYWKINSRISLMEQMVEKQDEIISLLRKQLGEDKKPSKKERDSEPEVFSETESEEELYIGCKARTLVENPNVKIGTIVRVDRIDGKIAYCSIDMKDVGWFQTSELKLVD